MELDKRYKIGTQVIHLATRQVLTVEKILHESSYVVFSYQLKNGPSKLETKWPFRSIRDKELQVISIKTPLLTLRREVSNETR